MLTLDVPIVPREPGVQLLERVGVPVEDLDADEVRKRFPFLDTGRFWPNKPVTDDTFFVEPVGSIGGFLTPTPAS